MRHLASLLGLAAVLATNLAPEKLYRPEPGPARVATASLTLRDEARGKDLPVRVSWPEAEGPFPLLVWSHGAYGSRDGYQPLVEWWVARGYVVLQPTHADSLALDRPGNLDRVFEGWADRPRDVSFLLDSLPVIEQQIDGLAARIEHAAIGVGGHSFGAHTAQLIGGVQGVQAGRRLALRDSRARCVLLISPQGRGGELDETSFGTLAVPMLTITGTRDTGRGGQDYRWRLDCFNLCPPGAKYLAVIDGADHGFGGISGARLARHEANPDHLAYVRSASLAFWERYLKDEPEAIAWLAGDDLSLASGGVVSLTRR